MNNRETIEAFHRSANISVGMMIECAMDNAGLDGANCAMLSDDDASEIVWHLKGIVDGRMLPSADESDYEAARTILGANE